MKEEGKQDQPTDMDIAKEKRKGDVEAMHNTLTLQRGSELAIQTDNLEKTSADLPPHQPTDMTRPRVAKTSPGRNQRTTLSI
ncbi:hypothetical protein R1flu_001806 [Riccia fluitans]|uniref:Uncharacterized protein n=1 Tax=Riccia fluitans TaxID=41844 RepID=A0ABD1Y4Q8_9MARC